MVQGLVIVLAVLVALSLFPVALLAALFRVVDYLADDEKFRRARRGSGSPNVSDGTGSRPPGRVGEGSQEYALDPADVGAMDPDGDAGTVTCPTCGTENDPDYDLCENCVREL